MKTGHGLKILRKENRKIRKGVKGEAREKVSEDKQEMNDTREEDKCEMSSATEDEGGRRAA